MKTSFKFVLLALGLSAVMTVPAPAQQSKFKGCDNVSTSRDKTPKPDSRCQHAPPDKYLEQQKAAYDKFMIANPPLRQTKVGNAWVMDGVDRKGVPYRIVAGPGGYAGSGSAPQINVGSKTGGGSGGRISAR